MKENEYPGRGVLRCYACGEPYIDHKMQPCHTLGVDVLHISEHMFSGRLLPCGTPAAYRRHLKAHESPCQSCRDANYQYTTTRH